MLAPYPCLTLRGACQPGLNDGLSSIRTLLTPEVSNRPNDGISLHLVPAMTSMAPATKADKTILRQFFNQVQIVSRCIQNGVSSCIFGLKNVQTRSLQPLFKAFSTSRTLHGLALQLKDFLGLALHIVHLSSSLIIVARCMSSYGSPHTTVTGKGKARLQDPTLHALQCLQRRCETCGEVSQR